MGNDFVVITYCFPEGTIREFGLLLEHKENSIIYTHVITGTKVTMNINASCFVSLRTTTKEELEYIKELMKAE